MTSIMRTEEDGTKIWTNEKREYHREDGPAIEYTNGDKEWFINNKHHRIEGPAYEEINGYKAWYINDKRHRIEGPARIWPSGKKAWWIKGEQVTELVKELLSNSSFDDFVHLGILADYFAERGDFRLLDIIQPYLTESK